MISVESLFWTQGDRGRIALRHRILKLFVVKKGTTRDDRSHEIYTTMVGLVWTVQLKTQ
jgi:hypothetical protein